jgi:peptidylprolyl isomerase
MSAIPTPHPRRLAALGAALALALTLGACGDDSGGNVVADGEKDNSLPTQVAPTTTEPLPSAKDKPCKAPTDVPPAEGKPEVEMPVGEVPTELVKTDITPGDGAEAVVGKEIEVNYVGLACSTGMQFDSSWDNGAPAKFTLAEGGLIQGWVEGIPGMKVGGRRMLVIPGDLAYGPEGNTGIAPDEALVFVIDLISVNDPAETTTVPAAGETTTTPPADGSTTTAPTDATTTTTAATTTTAGE